MTPVMSVSSDATTRAWVLTNERSRLTVFSPPGTDIDSGITFALSRVGRDKFVTLDRAGFSCAPAPAADTTADQFDQA